VCAHDVLEVGHILVEDFGHVRPVVFICHCVEGDQSRIGDGGLEEWQGLDLGVAQELSWQAIRRCQLLAEYVQRLICCVVSHGADCVRGCRLVEFEAVFAEERLFL
jgi:hypothetical protein